MILGVDSGVVALVALVLVVDATIQALVDLGLGLVATPVITILDPALMPELLLVLAASLPLLTLIGSHVEIDWRGLAWVLRARVPGTAVGVFFLRRWAKAVFAKLDALNFDVWVAFHHEPWGDGDTNNWRKMQDRLSRMVPGGISGDIKFWLIVTGWTQEFNPKDTANQWSTLYPTGAPIYGLAYDNPYRKYGYRWVDGAKTSTMDTGWTEGSVYVDKLAARAAS